MPLNAPLPIDAYLEEIAAWLTRSNRLIIQASPGSGKTTRVPPSLLSTAVAHGGEVFVLEPRRLAAKLSALRVAAEQGEHVGETIGYQFRLESALSPRTKLRYLTEGMLLRILMNNPRLEKVSTVILDEFHERHLHTDVALSYLLHLQQTVRPDLRLVIMSATLETESLQKHLEDCPVLRVEGRQYPVVTHYLKSAPEKPLEVLVKEAVFSVLRRQQEAASGDMLIFLPGMAEIKRCQEFLGQHLTRREAVPYALHGELPKEEQQRAVEKQNHRKIILSTNVAETSLTIEGVSVVIDSGLHKLASYSPWSGLPSLRTRPISQASAIQRAGRAGRLGPGLCLRLFTEGDFLSRLPFDPPEILRADLSQPLLELKTLGISDPKSLPWLEPPREGAMESAARLLYLLGALEKPETGAALLEVGKKMAHLPVHPRLARLLLEAHREGVLESAANLAALVSEGNLETLDAIEEALQGRLPRSSERAKRQFLSQFEKAPQKLTEGAAEKALGRAVLCGFPDRVGKLKQSAPKTLQGKPHREILFAGGGSSVVTDHPLFLREQYFVVLEAQQTNAGNRIYSLAKVEENWLLELSPSLLAEADELKWDKSRGCVIRVSRILYGAIPLSENEAPLREEDRPQALAILVKETGHRPNEPLPSARPETWVTFLNAITKAEAASNQLARVLSASRYHGKGETGWEDVRARLCDALSQLPEMSARAIETLDWEEIVAGAFPDRNWLEKNAPGQIQLPSGRKTKIHYELDKPPWTASRLQDFFGMAKGPSLFEGRVPLTLHLLAPNQRPVQISSDLAGFWEREYPRIRKELSRRYPRHAWPEDPFGR